ncbi:MAG: Lar family restriction alleviation protein [Desulfuromonadales bacterium]|nr:Lar family restriction alleviation protein [Desulfuromonadales bacterium]
MKEIRPCPFCGEHDVEWDADEEHVPVLHWVYCPECQCTSPTGVTHEDVVEMWNGALR